MTKLNEIRDNEGATKGRMRVGRGPGSGKGKTAGRGVKGQKSRSGVAIHGFEGGQMPLHMRMPKLRGFNNPFRVEYQAVNLDALDASGLAVADPESMLAAGLTHKGALVKVLGRGEITRPMTVRAHGFSKSAEAAITAAGGSVEILPLPWGDRRPPANGSQFTNR